MALCLAAAALAVTLPIQAFTLSWMHSIEKIRWEEDYRVVDQHLVLTEARIRGSGAGMDPPDGAVLRDGVWHYTPALAPLPRLRLARSPFTVDYTMCWEGHCHPMAELAGPPDSMVPVEVFACQAASGKR